MTLAVDTLAIAVISVNTVLVAPVSVGASTGASLDGNYQKANFWAKEMRKRSEPYLIAGQPAGPGGERKRVISWFERRKKEHQKQGIMRISTKAASPVLEFYTFLRYS